MTVIENGVRLKDQTLNFIEGPIRMLGDRMLVKPLPPHLSQTIAADWNGEAVRGEVLAVGPGEYPNIHTRFYKDGKEVRQVRRSNHFKPTTVKVGQVVQLGGMEIGGYLWPKCVWNGIDCVIVTEKDVTGIETADEMQ